MATTRESIEDGARWVLNVLRIGLRRAFILAIFVALFAAAVVWTTRERVSDCRDVTDSQRAVLASLLVEDPGRSFRADSPSECVEGVFRSLIIAVDGEIGAATDQLVADGWVQQTEYVGYFVQAWRRCFRLEQPGWERVHIVVDADRGGAVRSVTAVAPEQGDACVIEPGSRGRTNSR